MTDDLITLGSGNDFAWPPGKKRNMVTAFPYICLDPPENLTGIVPEFSYGIDRPSHVGAIPAG